jgi:hypothetical protein
MIFVEHCLVYKILKFFVRLVFVITRCSKMEIQSIGGMMLKAGEWTGGGKQKRT